MAEFMTYQEALQWGINCETTPPEEVHTCEYCGKILPYKCVVLPGKSINRFYPAPCDCEQAINERRRKDEEDLELLIKKTQAQYLEHCMKRVIADSGVKAIYQNATFERFKATTQKQQAAKMAVMKYAVEFPEFYCNPDENKKGLFLHGSVGTGKTFITSALCNDLASRGIHCIFTTTDDMMGEIRETFNGEGSEQVTRNRYKDISVLILDDLGKEKATEWHTSTLYDIVNSRWSDGRVTIVTANHDPETLIDLLTPKGSKDQTKADAIVSRIIGASRQIIPMYWDDYRRIN